MELDSDTISRYNTGELLTILNSDTIMFKELFCRIIPHMFDAVFVLVTAILLLAGINPYLLIIPVILIPFFATALLRFRKLAKQNFTLIRANNSNMSLTVQENIEAVRLVRSFTNEKLEKEKFNAGNQKVKESYVKQVKLSSSFEAVFSLIRQTAYIGSNSGHERPHAHRLSGSLRGLCNEDYAICHPDQQLHVPDAAAAGVRPKDDGLHEL